MSDDNAFVESLFRTAKYRPEFPASGGFKDLQAARQWASDFVHWYNHDHCHSGIRYVSPAQRHAGAGPVDPGGTECAVRPGPSGEPETLVGQDTRLVDDRGGHAQFRARMCGRGGRRRSNRHKHGRGMTHAATTLTCTCPKKAVTVERLCRVGAAARATTAGVSAPGASPRPAGSAHSLGQE